MEILPSTSSSSSPATSRPSTHRPFDVFINHRGMDVKNTLVSHIYYALESRGIRVFLDKDRMETGESITAQIEDAIRNASVHVAIFSKNYAGSRWCLDELCLMMEDPEKILAVFYDVEPCDLRWTDKDGPYAKAFKTLQEKGRFKEEWKTALFKAAGRSGCELQKGFNGDEGALVNHIVNNVLKRVKRPPLHVAKYPVGLDEVAEDFEKAMLLLGDAIDDENVKVVGIVGMGGAGKTTLAKHLFNNKQSSYGIHRYYGLNQCVRHMVRIDTLYMYRWMCKAIASLLVNRMTTGMPCGQGFERKNRIFGKVTWKGQARGSIAVAVRPPA